MGTADEELLAEFGTWAYEPLTLAPRQDYDLELAVIDFAPLLLEIASDPACPKRDFALGVLYILAGDAGELRLHRMVWPRSCPSAR
ncbi:hypothetical protein [Prauserella flavalba]|uniref:hypothetical protein n=1 Tax=Prauserella flavalba TaxID=1477506 RepID=UPI0036E2F69A